MRKIGFVYKRTSKVIVPFDIPAFMVVRTRYFAVLDELDTSGTKIFWHDETWANKNEEGHFVWTDKETGVDQMRGKRLPISTLLNESRFHKEIIDIFECDNNHILLTILADPHNIPYYPPLSVTTVGKVSHKYHHSMTKDMRSHSVIRVTARSPKNNIHPTKIQSANPRDILFPMSTISAARYHQDKSQAVVIGEEEGKKEYMRDASPQIKSAKQIVSQHFGKPINNRTHANNATKFHQYSKSSIQVR
ncbi:unnamed protein product [Rotaria sordida]|uniref:Uncharacterized protein n=1 Tax=Rotaria sordida TaxID=392033 RepID=A0A814PLV2_9BILA|nr:unnamed protein product [Rotaria sordida]